MFVELTREAYEKLKARLDAMNIKYEASDCTLPGEKCKMVHVEIPDELSLEEKRVINNYIDDIYGAAVVENVYEKDRDGNGTPDILEEEGKVVEVRRRTWDNEMHTPGKEAAAWFTGKSEEEEVTYETR